MKGIYKIENKINGKCYIGESLDIEKRFTEHIKSLTTHKHHSWKLQKDWNEFGEDNFDFKIIETLHESIKNTYIAKFILIAYEDRYIKLYNSIEYGYNCENTLEDVLNEKKILFNTGDSIMMNNILNRINNHGGIYMTPEMFYEDTSKLILCINNNLEFNSINQIAEYYHVLEERKKSILLNLQGKQKTCSLNKKSLSFKYIDTEENSSNSLTIQT